MKELYRKTIEPIKLYALYCLEKIKHQTMWMCQRFVTKANKFMRYKIELSV